MAPNLWTDEPHALAYLERGRHIPFRQEGTLQLLDRLPAAVTRVLDLGTGDGRLLAEVLERRPQATGVALDFSDTMLAAAGERFAGDDRVTVERHDLDAPLPDRGGFDVVVSGFAIHHVADGRKRALYGEIHACLEPGGTFFNLEHVASATDRLHREFLDAIGVDPADDDPSNKLASVEAQLRWLRDVGFRDVDCHWKWRELALLGGVRPQG
jgi:SAM-dependent methyltransferase